MRARSQDGGVSHNIPLGKLPEIGPNGRAVLRNPNVPTYSSKADPVMYAEMLKAVLRALPRKEPGLTQAEIREQVVRFLSQSLYPQGKKADWWSKAVQLDLEARGYVIRETTKPLRWHLAK